MLKIRKISDPPNETIIQKSRKNKKSLHTKEIIGILKAKDSFNSVKEVKKMEKEKKFDIY